MAEDEIIKHTKTVYETLHDREKNWKHKLKETLVEILLLFLQLLFQSGFTTGVKAGKIGNMKKNF
ncbi:MAG TPA: hypothetical protein VIH86_08645 [Puia sp.]